MSPYCPRKPRTASSEAARTALARTEPASNSTGVNQRGGAGPSARPLCSSCRRRLLLGLDGALERQLPACDLVDAVVGERGVAVVVDAVLAEDAVGPVRREDLLQHLVAIVALVAGALDGVEDHAHRLVSEDGVRVRVGHSVCLLVEVEEPSSGDVPLLVLLLRQGRDGDRRALRDVGRNAALLRVEEGAFRHAVRTV